MADPGPMKVREPIVPTRKCQVCAYGIPSEVRFRNDGTSDHATGKTPLFRNSLLMGNRPTMTCPAWERRSVTRMTTVPLGKERLTGGHLQKQFLTTRSLTFAMVRSLKNCWKIHVGMPGTTKRRQLPQRFPRWIEFAAPATTKSSLATNTAKTNMVENLATRYR